MSVLLQALHHPRKLWIRKAVFQIHLWAGVLLTLYVVVVALTGSILVFESELTGFALPAGVVRQLPATPIDPEIVVANVERAYPGASVEDLVLPNPDVPAFQLRVRLPDHRTTNFVADATTGALTPAPRTWVQWVHDLHVYLLLNPRYGAEVNAVGAAILMLLTVTGIALWWQGLRHWTRGLRVNVRASWRRVNYDLHSAIGFWTLALAAWWSLSGVYFGFYNVVSAAVNAVSPLRNMRLPVPLPASHAASRVPLNTVLDAAHRVSPHAHLYSVSNATLHDPTVYASMDLAAPGDFLHRDIVCLDASNARILSVWHYSEKHSLGDWFLWLMHPLHFGTQWGFAVKVVWAVLGLGLAILAVTGLIMYGNRLVRSRQARLRHCDAV